MSEFHRAFLSNLVAESVRHRSRDIGWMITPETVILFSHSFSITPIKPECHCGFIVYKMSHKIQTFEITSRRGENVCFCSDFCAFNVRFSIRSFILSLHSTSCPVHARCRAPLFDKDGYFFFEWLQLDPYLCSWIWIEVNQLRHRIGADTILRPNCIQPILGVSLLKYCHNLPRYYSS